MLLRRFALGKAEHKDKRPQVAQSEDPYPKTQWFLNNRERKIVNNNRRRKHKSKEWWSACLGRMQEPLCSVPSITNTKQWKPQTLWIWEYSLPAEYMHNVSTSQASILKSTKQNKQHHLNIGYIFFQGFHIDWWLLHVFSFPILGISSHPLLLLFPSPSSLIDQDF